MNNVKISPKCWVPNPTGLPLSERLV